MKIWIPNELVFTVFFGKVNASERMRDIFEEEYGRIDKAFTNIQPETVYEDNIQNNREHAIAWN